MDRGKLKNKEGQVIVSRREEQRDIYERTVDAYRSKKDHIFGLSGACKVIIMIVHALICIHPIQP
jgi:hypothetical protein